MRVFAAIVSALIAVVASAVAMIAAAAPAQRPAPDWQISATLAESCSCVVACPCNFGGAPSHDPCQGNRLVSISKGHVGSVDLAGVSFVVTWSLGDWTDITISDTVTEAQRAALDTVLPLAFGSMRRSQVQVTKAPIAMEMTANRVRFTTPDATVDMTLMTGAGGQAVKVLNLPNPLYQDYTQYRSVVHDHRRGAHSFSHTGTNGFTSTWEARSPR